MEKKKIKTIWQVVT